MSVMREKLSALFVAKTDNQKELFRAISENTQVICLGPAGTGKTHIPVVSAIQMLKAKKIERIVVLRPAVNGGNEDHGFIPGDINEKMEPWVRPILAIMEDAMGRENVIALIKNGKFEAVPFTYLRGRTFNDSFIILDEAQNATVQQMQLFLTRLGENSKVVINGDLTQSDLNPKMPNGLKVVLDMVRTQDLPVPIIEMTVDDCVRSEACKMWIQAFATWHQKQDTAPEPRNRQSASGRGKRQEPSASEPLPVALGLPAFLGMPNPSV